MTFIGFDRDGILDIYVNAIGPDILYPNLGNLTFSNVAAAEGVATDLDANGWLDLFTGNRSFDLNRLYMNSSGTFSDQTAAAGIDEVGLGMGVLSFDFDNDGDLDLVVTADAGSDTRLWRNDTVTSNRWLVLELEGQPSNRSAIGARIEVETELGTVVKEVSGGAGRGSQNSLPVEFGLGAATQILELRIRWPSGNLETIAGVGLDQYLHLGELSLFFDGFEGGDLSRWAFTSLGARRR